MGPFGKTMGFSVFIGKKDERMYDTAAFAYEDDVIQLCMFVAIGTNISSSVA